jgi:hypothetical protein
MDDAAFGESRHSHSKIKKTNNRETRNQKENNEAFLQLQQQTNKS